MLETNYDRYSVNEEIANSLIHVLGVYLSIAFSTVMCMLELQSHSFSPLNFTSILIYGISSTLMFTMSSAYHCIQYIPAKRILKLLDHISIYFAIAGMNTPVCLFLLKDSFPKLCYAIMSIQWAAVVLGTIMKIKTVGRLKNLSTILYLVLGWVVASAIYPIWMSCSPIQLTYLLTGGILYTIGSLFYTIKTIKYFHCIWHMFVLVASIFHFLFIMSLIK